MLAASMQTELIWQNLYDRTVASYSTATFEFFFQTKQAKFGACFNVEVREMWVSFNDKQRTSGYTIHQSIA